LARHNCEHFTSFGLREPAMESTHLGLRENFHNGNPGVLSELIKLNMEKHSDCLPSRDY